MEKAELHAGFVVPSTLATLNLLRPPVEDTLFVKIAPGCVTTTVFQKQRFQFYRRVPEMPIYRRRLSYGHVLPGQVDAEVGFERVVVCSYDGDTRRVMVRTPGENECSSASASSRRTSTISSSRRWVR